MSPDPKRVVADGYDRIADAYANWALRASDPTKRRFAKAAIDSAPAGGHLMDLGCGTGEHVTALLAGHFDVLGVDISPRSIELARARVPDAAYIVADMTELDVEPASVAVVTAFFSLIHVPRAEHADMLKRIAGWLQPGGTLVITMGTTQEDSYADDWLGAPMYWSHWDRTTNEQLVADAGLDIVSSEVVFETGLDFSHLWVVARRPS